MKKNAKKAPQPEPQEPITPAKPAERPPIDFSARRSNRALNTESLVTLLRQKAPNLYELAEVVGQWVWIRFADKQPASVTRALSEFGFHWNRARQCWQHAGGAYDPRKRYRSYFPADAKLA